MTKLLKKEQQVIVAQLCSLDLQIILGNHSKVFETPKGLPHIHDHDHAIHLIPGSFPPNIRPYRYPYTKKSEIDRMVAKMLEAGIIQPSQIYFSTLVVFEYNVEESREIGLIRFFSR